MHYGSTYAMADYKSEVHNLYATASFAATSQLRLNGTVSYNLSTASYDPVEMPDVSSKLEGALGHQDFSFDQLHEYSDFDYALLRFGLAAEYAFTPTVSVTGEVDYADLTDNTGYVYGIESGSFLTLRSGVRVVF